MREEIYLDPDIDRTEKKVPANPIPDRQYDRFIYALIEVSGELSERNVTLTKLDIATGYRLQDITDLTVGDIRKALKRGYFEIQEKKQFKSWKRHMKNNPYSNRKKPDKRISEIESGSNIEKILYRYIKDKKDREYAFTANNSKDFIKPKSFSRVLSNAGKLIGLENISGHSLRKTYATWIYEDTRDLEMVRIALGHKSIETTKLYLGIKKEVLKRASKIMSRRV